MARKFLKIGGVCRFLVGVIVGGGSLIAGSPAWASPAAIASQADCAGVWKGTIDIPGMKLTVEVTLKQEGDGLSGTIDIPQQGASDLALESVTQDGATVTFQISGVPGEPTFKGTLDGTKLIGDFIQGGQAFPFMLVKDAKPAFDPAKGMEGFDHWVDKALIDWEVPGMGVAVVADGKVILSQGFGKRDIANDLPATSDTLFAIGSSTKAFTTFVLATLIEEGKLSWDKPVIDCWPQFKVADGERTREITPRDMVTHRTGMPRHDFSWYNSEATRDQLVERMAHLECNAALRERWQYNNFMFLAAGVLGERLTGKTWEENVRERIFQPLGMSNSNFGVDDSQRSPDHALPYDKREGSVVAIPFRGLSAMGPAGSINSSANDMAKWVQVQLTGMIDGREVLPKNALSELHRPAMVMTSNETQSHVIALGYAAGWFVDMYRGELRIHHGGNIDGFTALVFFFPRKQIGGVVLSNRNGTPLPEMVSEELSDRLMQLPSLGLYDTNLSKAKAAEVTGKKAQQNLELMRRPNAAPSHVLSAYSGTYVHPGYGKILVEGDDSALVFTYNRMAAPLNHWHYDTFSLGKSQDPAAAELEHTQVLFRTDIEGGIAGIELRMEPSIKPVVFERAGDSSLSDPAAIEKFVGSYSLMESMVVAITRRDRTLVATVPGQPPYELVPLQSNTFKLKSLDGYRMRFDIGEDGSVTKALFIQPNGVFEATRMK